MLAFTTATVGATLASSTALALALAVGGTVVAFGTIIALYFVYDDEFFPSTPPYDERTKRIERYATRNSWFVLLTALMAAMSSRPYLPAWFRDGYLLPVVVLLGLAAFGGSWSRYERRM